jgi:hypothetical protein
VGVGVCFVTFVQNNLQAMFNAPKRHGYPCPQRSPVDFSSGGSRTVRSSLHTPSSDAGYVVGAFEACIVHKGVGSPGFCVFFAGYLHVSFASLSFRFSRLAIVLTTFFTYKRLLTFACSPSSAIYLPDRFHFPRLFQRSTEEDITNNQHAF